MQTSYSLNKIDNIDDFGFNPSDYSKFKFGDDLVAEKYGISLAKGFINDVLNANRKNNQIVVITSPYSFIPTATYAMKNYFVYELNKWLSENNLPVAQETKIHRTITYKEDYGELNAEDRMKLIGNDKFHIDKLFLSGKTLIFLDDIRITGSHERMINKMISEFEISNDTYLLYFAELINKNINPNFENYLNYHHIKSIFDLDNIIKSDRFVINTRIVKYILNYEHNAFKIFIQNQTLSFNNLLNNMALGNSYHTIDEYVQNLKALKKHLNSVYKSIK
jgi:PRTase ComF-like